MYATETAGLWTSAHQYYVMGALEGFGVDGFSYTGFNGLLAPLSAEGEIAAPGTCAVIMTGTELGTIKTTVTVYQKEPPAPDLTQWDDVVEASLFFSDAEPYIVDVHDRVLFSVLTSLQRAPFRLRVHARGRDQGYEFLRDESEDDEDEWSPEEHLLQAWPAPFAPLIEWQLHDTFGAGIRAS
ncbi:hypothetical protein [Streptomyces lasiicapitis]|uniref:hypothetical protein n=1 Tax=Streptomyces lasiicapitis TaxID=1923961 RepID=UPI00364A6226